MCELRDNIARSVMDESLHITVTGVSAPKTILKAVFTTLSSLHLWSWLMPPNHTHIENARILSIAER